LGFGVTPVEILPKIIFGIFYRISIELDDFIIFSICVCIYRNRQVQYECENTTHKNNGG
jgi:hypothetical protein